MGTFNKPYSILSFSRAPKTITMSTCSPASTSSSASVSPEPVNVATEEPRMRSHSATALANEQKKPEASESPLEEGKHFGRVSFRVGDHYLISCTGNLWDSVAVPVNDLEHALGYKHVAIGTRVSINLPKKN